MPQQYTGPSANNRDDIAQLDGTNIYPIGQQQQHDGAAQLDGTGVYPHGAQQQQQQQQQQGGGGTAVPARRPVGQGGVYEAP